MAKTFHYQQKATCRTIVFRDDNDHAVRSQKLCEQALKQSLAISTFHMYEDIKQEDEIHWFVQSAPVLYWGLHPAHFHARKLAILET